MRRCGAASVTTRRPDGKVVDGARSRRDPRALADELRRRPPASLGRMAKRSRRAREIGEMGRQVGRRAVARSTAVGEFGGMGGRQRDHRRCRIARQRARAPRGRRPRCADRAMIAAVAIDARHLVGAGRFVDRARRRSRARIARERPAANGEFARCFEARPSAREPRSRRGRRRRTAAARNSRRPGCPSTAIASA